MQIKIQGGTIQHDGASLCVTCRHATIIQGPGLGDRIVQCGRLYGRPMGIPFPVVTCSGYSDRRQASLHEMEEIAWVLRTDPKRNRIGFVSAEERKPRDRYGLWEDED